HELALPPGTSALRDYWETGQFEGRSPHPLFEPAWYQRRYAGGTVHANAVVDLIHAGLAEGRVPHRALDGDASVGRDPDAVRRMIAETAAMPEPRGPRRVSTK